MEIQRFWNFRDLQVVPLGIRGLGSTCTAMKLDERAEKLDI